MILIGDDVLFVLASRTVDKTHPVALRGIFTVDVMLDLTFLYYLENISPPLKYFGIEQCFIIHFYIYFQTISIQILTNRPLCFHTSHIYEVFLSSSKSSFRTLTPRYGPKRVFSSSFSFAKTPIPASGITDCFTYRFSGRDFIAPGRFFPVSTSLSSMMLKLCVGHSP